MAKIVKGRGLTLSKALIKHAGMEKNSQPANMCSPGKIFTDDIFTTVLLFQGVALDLLAGI